MAASNLILGRYKPLGELGSGGFASVIVARDTRMQRKVAIKIIELTTGEALQMQNAEALDYAAQAKANAEAATAQAPQPTAPVVPSLDDIPPWEEPIDLNEYEPSEWVSPWQSPGDEAPGRTWDAPSQEPAPDDLLEDDEQGAPGSDDSVRFFSNISGLDEARAVATFSDADIVAVHDFAVEGTTAYLIMEFVDGMTLTQLLRAHGNDISLDVIAAVFSHVAHAIEVAHDNNMLHLDIKPDNVLINKKGQVKVTDFGLAKLADANGFGVAGGGTIGYMPLEQMRQENLDARCDEWALASLTYEMIAGENPFLARTLPEAEKVLEDAELVLPSLCWEELDEGIDDIMFRALDLDREERYPTVSQFAEELAPYLGDPKKGTRELADWVSGKVEEEEPEEEKPVRPHREGPFVDSISDRAGSIISRIICCIGAAIMGALCAFNLPFTGGWSDPVLWGVVAACVVAAGIKPHVGTLVWGCLLGATLTLCNAPIVGIATIVLCAALWWFAGRSNPAACAAASVGLGGPIGFGILSPVLAGCLCGTRQAFGTTVFASWMLLVLGSWGIGGVCGFNFDACLHLSSTDGQAALISQLQSISVWIIIASWVLSAATFSLCCKAGKRAVDILGAALACAILITGVVASAGATSNWASFAPNPFELGAAIAAGALGILAAILLIPDRVRWEKEGPKEESQARPQDQEFSEY